MAKPQLVLDAGGVIVTNFSASFLLDLAVQEDVSFERLKSGFRDLRESFWTGRLPESAFWDWLEREIPKLNREEASRSLIRLLKPLPAFRLLPEWSRHADLHLLSNHRAEWLLPVLEPIRPYLKSITVSSEAGHCKPDPQLYAIANAMLSADRPRVLFVDDQEKNFAAAAAIGWETILADENGEWLVRVESIWDG